MCKLRIAKYSSYYLRWLSVFSYLYSFCFYLSFECWMPLLGLFSLSFPSFQCKWVVLFDILDSLSYHSAKEPFHLKIKRKDKWETRSCRNEKAQKCSARLRNFWDGPCVPWYRISSLICCFCLNIPLPCLRRTRLAALTGFRGT